MRHKKLAVLLSLALAIAAIPLATSGAAASGPPTNNGWFGGHQIYYLDQGVEKKADRAHLADIFLIGGNRAYQANVVDSVPGDAGYSPHWDVNVVNTAPGVTLERHPRLAVRLEQLPGGAVRQRRRYSRG